MLKMFGWGRSFERPSTDCFALACFGGTLQLTYLGPRDGEEADTHQHSADGNLTISEFDTIEINDTQAVCADETIESKNFVHLDRRN